MFGARQLALGEHVELVGSEYPGLAALLFRALSPALHLNENRAGRVTVHFLPGV